MEKTSKETNGEMTSDQLPSRKEMLKKVAFGLGAAFTGVIATSEKAEAHTKTLADVPMEVEWNSSAAPGVVLLGQADGTWTPGAAAYPAAVAGWTTVNTNVPYGVYGYSVIPGGSAIVGLGFSGALAGYFAGDVQVTGNFTVFGAKNAAVPHPDGSHRRVYSVESPESWFEDFGQSVLSSGQAEVRLDPDFAAIVHNDSYQVFLTEYGESGGLYVSSRDASGFTVRERAGGSSNIAFGYRAVAKRKDIPGPRLEKVTVRSAPAQGQAARK